MALDAPVERRDEVQIAMGNGNGVAPSQPSRPAGRPTAAAAAAPYADRRLRLNPNADHKPEDYSDVRGEYAPAVYSALERHLPPSLIDADRDVKLHFMRDILARYWPQGERNKVWLSIPLSHLQPTDVRSTTLLDIAQMFLCYFYWYKKFGFVMVRSGTRVTIFFQITLSFNTFGFCFNVRARGRSRILLSKIFIYIRSNHLTIL